MPAAETEMKLPGLYRPVSSAMTSCWQRLVRSVQILTMAVCIAVGTAAPEERSLTLDDVLSMEGIGTGVADPSGRWFIFERLRPYDKIGDYSFRTYAFGGKSGHQLWRFDLTGDRPPELLPGVDPAPFTWQMGFSPGGHYLTLLQYSKGQLNLGVYDMAREQATRFIPVPAYSKTGDHDPVWVSDHEIVYSAVPDGDLPRFTSVRAHTGAVLAQAWEDAWRGDVVTASEVRTRPTSAGPVPVDGKLILFDVRTGESRVLAEGLFADLRVAPGGRHLAALKIFEAPARGTDGSFDTEGRVYRLTVIDLRTGNAQHPLPGLTFFPYTLVWSPDGVRLAGFSWPDGTAPREGRFRGFDTTAGEVTVYEHRGLELASERERGWLQRPERALYLGDALVVFARPQPEGPEAEPLFSNQDFFARDLPRADWYALYGDRGPKNLTGFLEGVSGVPVHAGADHIFILAGTGIWRVAEDGSSRPMSPLIAGSWRYAPQGNVATHSLLVRPDFQETGLFEVSTPEMRYLLAVTLDGENAGRIIRFELAPGSQMLAVSLPARRLLTSTPDALTTRLQVLGPEGSIADIAVLNAHLDEVDPGRWRSVSYSVNSMHSDGKEVRLESCVLLPPGYDGAGSLPLIVEVYPDIPSGCREGPARTIGQVSPVSPYLWAGRGYAYVRLSTPVDLLRSSSGPLGGLGPLIEAGTEAVIGAGIADPERVMLYGFSQGGISALLASAQTERFRGVIAMNSWADLFSDYFGPLGIYSYVYGERFGANAIRYELTTGSEFGFGKSAFDAPEEYLRNSPVFLAHQIDIPVLLIHSDMDAFPMSQFDEMYGALRHAGKDVRYVRYWGEGHAPSSPANIRDLWKRWDAFLLEQGIAAHDDVSREPEVP